MRPFLCFRRSLAGVACFFLLTDVADQKYDQVPLAVRGQRPGVQRRRFLPGILPALLKEDSRLMFDDVNRSPADASDDVRHAITPNTDTGIPLPYS